MTRPNFFIVGAPKCGTTALYEYLSVHSEIYMSPYKEPHYFATDFPAKANRTAIEADYLKLFDRAGNAKRIGEASVYYLFSKEAARNIHAFNPDAKIIIMLRNPVEAIYSYHSQQIYTQNEDLDFPQALAAETERHNGSSIPKTIRTMVDTLYYTEIFSYTEQVQRYIKVFGREDVHIIIFDDFRADVADSYRDTLAFLGVDPNFQPDFTVINANKRAKNSAMQGLLLRPPKWLNDVGQAAKPFARPLYWWLLRLNAVAERRSTLPKEIRFDLEQRFAPDIAQLSDLLERNLTHWCQQTTTNFKHRSEQ